jgi:pilus assembly protein Flp/PilA
VVTDHGGASAHQRSNAEYHPRSTGSLRYANFRRIAMLRHTTQFLVEFLRREDGPTAVEYAVMLALIVVVCLIAITALGTNANQTFGEVSASVASTTGS